MSTARAIAILILAALVGIVGYQIGATQALGTAAPAVAPAVAPVGYWGWGPGWFFFPFGIFFWIFGLFLFFGLLRMAFGGGRGWGHRYGYGRGPYGDEARSRIEEIHKELHGEKPPADRGSGPSTST